MTATAAMLVTVRRWTAEQEPGSSYSDEELATIVEAYPLPDTKGRRSDHDDWIPGYDLHAAAADVWEEKAATLQTDFDFSADGGNFKMSQGYDQALRQARSHRSQRSIKTARMTVGPRVEDANLSDF